MMCHSSFYLYHCIFCEKFSCASKKMQLCKLKDAADKTTLPQHVESYFCNTLISFVKTVAVLEIRVGTICKTSNNMSPPCVEQLGSRAVPTKVPPNYQHRK
eukprot:sb/3478454/